MQFFTSKLSVGYLTIVASNEQASQFHQMYDCLEKLG